MNSGDLIDMVLKPEAPDTEPLEAKAVRLSLNWGLGGRVERIRQPRVRQTRRP